ncbi:hypothetical protein [Halobacillus naozhouensis]|uniref:Uncharacterized protein n=1 Tax=Halobacillus naozhouensis TaxID=554880 RepID=A0ABY8J1Y7_9BACI|nr:hypothetical protein [Halobacillus naozhouensis]WFT76514.1 hypothetical protein P9989_09185 [Halobacillus naozhouensis]
MKKILGRWTVELAKIYYEGLREKDTTVRLHSNEYDVQNFPKLLIHIDVISDSQEDSEDIEKTVKEIGQLAKVKSLLQKDES